MKLDHKKRRKRDPKPPGYWKEYEQERKISGKLFKTGFRQVQKAVDKFLEDHPGYGPQIRCALTNWITMKICTLLYQSPDGEYERKPSIRRDAEN